MIRSGIIGTSLFFLLFSLKVQAQNASVDGSTIYQTISGWGASTGYSEGNQNLTSAEADCFFSTSNGACPTGNSIGLSWIRIQDNGAANNAPDLSTLQEAVARGASVELGFNPQGALTSSNYASVAAYDVAKIQYFQANGVPIAAVSPINEPVNTGTTPGAIDTFVASYLWPAMNSAGLGSTPLTLSESANWFVTDYVSPCMGDANCSSHVPAVSGHPYFYGAGSQGTDGFQGGWSCCIDYAANPLPSSTSGKAVWQTEVNGGVSGGCDSGTLANWDSSMSPDALVYAHNIHDFLTVVGGSQWLYWNLESGYGCNDGLTDASFNPAKRFYAIGNWSRFVRPGWVRIAATANPQSGIYVTAFLNKSTGAFAIVSINNSGNSVSQTFSLTGLSATSVIPWITSSSENLSAQSSVPLSSSGFTYTLPAFSVTTFVGTANVAPNPPTGLTSTVVQ